MAWFISQLFGRADQRRPVRERALGALALHRRGEVRNDGLSLISLTNRLEIEWQARGVHPWYQHNVGTAEKSKLFAEQCLADADAAVERLFAALPEVDEIELRVLDPLSSDLILAGSVRRCDISKSSAFHSAGMKLKIIGVRYRLNNWRFEALI